MIGNNTHIYNRFVWWSVEDCACEFCLYAGEDRSCTLDVCVIEDIRQEAFRHENGKCGDALAEGEVVPCPA